MSNKTWLNQIESNYPQFIPDFDNKWHNVIIDVLDQLLKSPKPNTQIRSLDGLKKYTRHHFSYIKRDAFLIAISEKIKKQFDKSKHLTVFSKYYQHFPLIFPDQQSTDNKSFSIIDNFLDDSIQMVDDNTTTDADCVTIQRGNTTFRVRSGVRTIEFEGITLTF